MDGISPNRTSHSSPQFLIIQDSLAQRCSANWCHLLCSLYPVLLLCSLYSVHLLCSLYSVHLFCTQYICSVLSTSVLYSLLLFYACIVFTAHCSSALCLFTVLHCTYVLCPTLYNALYLLSLPVHCTSVLFL